MFSFGFIVATLLFVTGLAPTPTHAGGAICTEITTESFSGFGAAYNLFSGANELIVRASCASDSFTPEIGSEATDASNFAAYTTGYYYDGSAWQAYSLSPGSGAEQYGDWILGDARGGAISYQGSPTFFAAYTCHWRGSDGWQCGCSSAACGSSAWQLQAVTPPGAVGGGGTGGGTDDGGDWRLANVTWYTSWPDPGSEECIAYNGCRWAGYFAGVDGQRSEEWVAARNIAAVHQDDFGDLEGRWLTIRNRETGNTMDVQVLDLCADSDCNGCCTRNLGDEGFLIDLESHTSERFWGSPRNGVVEWRVNESR